MFWLRGESGGEVCDGRMGEEESGEGTAGRCGEEKPILNMGAGIVADISSLGLGCEGGIWRIDYLVVAVSGEVVALGKAVVLSVSKVVVADVISRKGSNVDGGPAFGRDCASQMHQSGFWDA